MAMVRGKEVFAQVVVGAGEDTLNRRIHEVKWVSADGEALLLEGKALPHFVHIDTVKNAEGKNVMTVFEGAAPVRKEFSPTTLFLITIGFCGVCAYVIVAAINAHRCFG